MNQMSWTDLLLLSFVIIVATHMIKVGCWTVPVTNNRRVDRSSKSVPLQHSANDPPTTHSQPIPPPRLVVLIPAYNEESRIRSTLESYTAFLQKFHADLDPQIWVVDDGSTDSTIDVVTSFSKTGHEKLDNVDDKSNQPSRCAENDRRIKIRCIPMEKNGGKGAALAKGVSVLAEEEEGDTTNVTVDRNVIILTQDADGSGDLKYLQSMLEKLTMVLERETQVKNNSSDDDDDGTNNVTSFWSHPAVVIGNRNYDFFTPRGVTRWGFQTTVKLIMNDLRVSDSQCGYKLMTLPAAKLMYNKLHLQGWSHDVEVLYKAKLYDIPIDEISIDWFDKDGSKLVETGVLRVSLKMLLDVLTLRINHSLTGKWTLTDDENKTKQS
mmetsp:Transcript_21837/g.51522  ORF Transcript_21837/g.51522 Transcript_21837/m.51522 type:complete len:380 (+) Transcript_21837:105-1244(+)